MLNKVLTEIDRDGFCLCRGLAPQMSTIETAHALGTVVNVEQLLPSSGIPTVQTLRPRIKGEGGRNQYSGHFGLGVFPLHTDLAHWAVPPHYFLLRCVAGSNDVLTRVLSWTPIVESVGAAVLRKAVFAARKKRIGCSGLVRAMSQHEDKVVFRWDPIFIKPLTEQALLLADVLHDSVWNERASTFLLERPGDTLIVDNWRMLHGRGEVLPESTGRRIERVYLSEVCD
jgi:hypothetical protein